MSSSAPKPHEKFQVQESRLKVVRQDRIPVEEHDCFLLTDGQSYRLINISTFGALAFHEQKDIPDEFHATLVLNRVELGDYTFKVVRRQTSEEGGTIALETIHQPIAIEQVQATLECHEAIHRQNTYQQKADNVPEKFARKVYEVKDWLENLQKEITQIEQEHRKDDKEMSREFEQACVQIIGHYLNEILPIKNKDLQQYLADIDGDQVTQCYEFFREKLHDLIYQAPFSNRVFFKPLGYAGDYEMMNIIYKDTPSGNSLFSKCLHEYWVKQPAAQAVRNRAQYITGKLLQVFKQKNGNDTRILSIACGPAKEWQDIIQSGEFANMPVAIDLLDQDENALKFANRRMKELALTKPYKFQFNYKHKAIKNILVRGLDQKYDLIYSAGLFDYFSDPVVELAAAKLYDALKPGGQLIIGNFNVDNPNSIVMDLALDWHLIYRTEEDLHRLFKNTGGSIHIEKEPLNINLFCVIQKP